MKNHYLALWGSLATLALCGNQPLPAEVKMPAIFGDHMVLQQGLNLPVWGTANPGEQVTVTVGTETGKATATADGKWMVKLPPLPAGTVPVTMTVVGKNSLIFDDVLIGDVWICSGQSNMEFGIGVTRDTQQEIASANLPLLRLFVVPHSFSATPLDDIIPDSSRPALGHWVVCTPKSVASNGYWSGFSAVGFFFGRDILKTTGQPVGVIGTHWGGTAGECWTSLSSLQKDPALIKYVNAFDKISPDFPRLTADYYAKGPDFHKAWMNWEKTDGADYEKSLKAWNMVDAQARATGQPEPPRPRIPSSAPPAPPLPGGGLYPSVPTTLFNAMVAPIIPYGLKGVIWYQGESNTAAATRYQALFSQMIAGWREKWGEGDFPFLFVQLSILNKPEPEASQWSLLREAQLKTLSLPATGMAVTFDVGDPGNIHYIDKQDVGHRLALAADHIAYGKAIVYSGPIYDKMQIEDDAVRLSFTQIGSGLTLGAPPWLPPGKTFPSATSLRGFVVAGADQQWFPANARIDGDAVVVSSPQVPHPQAVRYAWAGGPQEYDNLYNKEGLPASPFRTDDWPIVLTVNPRANPPATSTLTPKP